MRLFLLSSLALLSFNSHSQTGSWELWSNTKNINAIKTDGNNIWLGTTGGLVLLNKISGAVQLFNSCNSGLPQNNVLQIIVDDLHRVWMVSQDLYGEEDMAISMYDGISWTEIPDYPEPWENYSGGERKFDIDQNLVLWVIAGYQLYQFNGTGWQVADVEMLGFEPESVQGLNRSSSGDLLLTSYNQNTGEPFVSIYNGEVWNTIVTTGAPVISQTVLYDAVMDDSGKLYAWNDNQEIFLFDGQNWTIINFPYTSYINNIVPEHDGTSIWIHASHKLIKYDGNAFYEMDTSYQAPYESWVTALAVDENDEIWWATPVSVIAYNHTDSVFYSANTSDLYYTQLLTTNTQHEALLANTKGFQIFKGSYFEILSPDTSRSYLRAGHGNASNTYYLRSDEDKIYKYTNGSWSSFIASPDLSDYDVDNLLYIDVDRFGNLMESHMYYDNWSPYDKGQTYWNMFFYNEALDVWTDPDCASLGSYALDDQNNFYWVDAINDALYKYDHVGNTSINAESYGISGTVGPIKVDHSNSLWVCSESGLTKITDNTHQTFDIPEFDLNTSYVSNLFIDHDNNLYAATNNGIAYFNGSGVNVINRSNSNIPSNIVSKVIADKFNNLWITTPAGIGFCANCGFSSIVGIGNIHEDIINAQVFPNPAHGTVVFQFNLPENAETSIDLFDVSGKKMATFFNGNLLWGQHSLNFATDFLTEGLYLLKLKTDNVVITRKLVVD